MARIRAELNIKNQLKNIGRNPIVDCEQNGEIQKRVEKNRKEKKMK